MSLREELKQNTGLILDDGVFYQAGLPRRNEFEQVYLSLRKKENRLYSDEIVKQLPDVTPDKTLKHEWQVRKDSVSKMIAYLKKKKTFKSILEVGCGNGWFANRLANDLSADVLAIDVNESELHQGSRVFSSEKLSFVYGDIFSIKLSAKKFNVVILASSIQYFPSIQLLIRRLLDLIGPDGEIHIIDSPAYTSDKGLIAAKKRSVEHFAELGHPEMAEYYFHHTMKEIGTFNYEVLENPAGIIPALKRRLFKKSQTVFPWIVIKAS